ncbi:F-box protein PP2-B10-like [Oryza brachyantha]|uniref:F-box protein PP2-B10-like n=1 Tax=Oryza brachyantha TaxID=4533 RepID=UPI001ADACCF7|nr:F-box protein PP2-B10-like [Oryza brachyantha]
MASGGEAAAAAEETRVGDLPEACLAEVIALTSPRDACRLAAVSPSFRAAAESDAVWGRFLPPDYRAVVPLAPAAPTPAGGGGRRKKCVYLGLCDKPVPVDDGSMMVWLEKESGAKCFALPARKLSLPWEDGEFSWRWTPHPLSRFEEVAQLVDCTCLDIYGRLPASALTPATAYAAYLVFGTAEGQRGLSFPDQETTVAIGGRVVARHAVCLRPDDAEARKFRGVGLGGAAPVRRPARRGDGWSEVEVGRVSAGEAAGGAGAGEDVVASFEVLGWYPKRGLLVECMEFRPVS